MSRIFFSILFIHFGFIINTPVVCAQTDTTSEQPKINITDMPLKTYAYCLDDAIKKNKLEKNGQTIVFTCTDNVAEWFYNKLGDYSIEATDRQYEKRGRYLARPVNGGDANSGSDICWHKIENSDGSAVSEYICNIYLPVGVYLNR